MAEESRPVLKCTTITGKFIKYCLSQSKLETGAVGSAHGGGSHNIGLNSASSVSTPFSFANIQVPYFYRLGSVNRIQASGTKLEVPQDSLGIDQGDVHEACAKFNGGKPS
jgi:hypothetical protein